MTEENRRRLTALIAASTKLDAALHLTKEADREIAASGLLPREDLQEIATDLDRYLRRIHIVFEKIPS